MTRSKLGWIVGGVVVAAACRGPDVVSTPAPGGGRVTDVSPTPTPALVDGPIAPADAAANPVTPSPSTAEPEREPEPPKLPDGTPILACAEPPPGMACVPGGAFIRGTDGEEPTNARPQATVWLQTFYIDVDEVTYRQYKTCEKERRCDKAGPNYLDFDHPNMPIQGVSWHHSRKYCQQHGKDLPTEAQWEKAARGPDGDLYPWGNDPVTCEQAIIMDSRGRSCGLRKGKSKPETGRPWDVGSRPAYRYGLHDMMGNSWEWVIDWYSPSYERCGAACEGTDPRGPCNGEEPCKGHYMRVVRGGSWYWPAEHATGIFRRPHFPHNEPFHHFGFRCAATVEQAQALRAAAAATPADADAAEPKAG